MAFFKKSKSLASLVGEEVGSLGEYNFDKNQDEYIASDNLNFSRQENFSDIQDEPQMEDSIRLLDKDKTVHGLRAAIVKIADAINKLSVDSKKGSKKHPLLDTQELFQDYQKELESNKKLDKDDILHSNRSLKQALTANKLK